MQQVAQQQLPVLTQIGNVQGIGPICVGPLGPGPCDAIRMYLAQATFGGPTPQFNLNDVHMTGSAGNFGPICNGPFGAAPCSLVGQFGLDRMGVGSIPNQSSFNLPQFTGATGLAAECARRSGLDIGTFVGCAGQQVILPQRDQAILDCAVASKSAEAFGRCAAQHTGIRLSQDQQLIADCAMRSKGQTTDFLTCAGPNFANRAIGPNEQAILNCAAKPGTSSMTFVECAGSRFLKDQELAVINCAVGSSDIASFASCAAPNASIKMSDDQRILARCALSSNGDESNFLSCAGSTFATRGLGTNERAVLNCASSSQNSTEKFAACAANKLVGGNLSKEQQVALRCAVESKGDGGSFLGCAAANMFSLQLNPEQQIAVQCVVSTGGEPTTAAGCIASRLTMRELTKCLSDGIGGKGCFGDSNDLVGRDGFVARTFGQIAGGPNSVINNPGQIWGGDNSFVRNPGQIWGGPNSFFNNPGQLLPTPKPIQVGSIGGKRICLPWC